MKNLSRTLFRCFASVCLVQAMCSTATSATVEFLPTLDASVVGTNTSSSIRYDSNSTSGAVGIPDASVTSYSDTFFFADTGTGIEFQFDITWTASPTSGGPAEFLDGDSNSLGVGTSNTVQDTETLTVAVSNLSVGFDNYISGSVSGITNPQLDSSSVSLHDVTFDDRNFGLLGLIPLLPGPNQSLIDITAGGSTVTWGDDAGEWGSGSETFEFGTDGLTTSESIVLLEYNSDSTVDLDFSLASTSFRVATSISQGSVTAVPEPSSFALLGVAMFCGFTRRKRRRAK